MKILILKSWVNGLLEGLRGMCFGTRQQNSVSLCHSPARDLLHNLACAKMEQRTMGVHRSHSLDLSKGFQYSLAVLTMQHKHSV